MAIKKSELYSALWRSCDELRGGMDASEYKDYILTLLFVKYVTDRYEGDRYAEIVIPEGGSFNDLVKAKGKSDIGERFNTTIHKLAETNRLEGVLNVADFNDSKKLGSGKDMVDKLTNLVSIFQDESLDFRRNRAAGDDIIGDAYEYLMRKFATESGKCKGQFYTPAEVSRVIAKLIGVRNASSASNTIYDMACGSASLLIRAADESPYGLSIYGQEYESTTAGLAKMNLVLHNKATGMIIGGKNTLSNPDDFGEENRRFDYAVANPPFSYKAWCNGIDLTADERFLGYGATPPPKNGDFAWLLHFIHSLKTTGQGAIILPHGVLFRGNAEGTIRESLIKRKYIKGIIGLPANLFYGTGIPACIIVIDKGQADSRKGIYMIDASKGFVKDGNKNRLREQDIRKIVDYFNGFLENDPTFARLVPLSEIERNEYNLNIPRYIDNGIQEDIQNIDAHINGGIPKADIDALENYWSAFEGLRNKLFKTSLRKGFYELKVPTESVQETIFNFSAFQNYAVYVLNAYKKWKKKHKSLFEEITDETNLKEFILTLGNSILKCFGDIGLIDKYDVYNVLMYYWETTMQDDVFAITCDGYMAGQQIVKDFKTKKDGTSTGILKSYEGKIIPKRLIIDMFFSEEQKAIHRIESSIEECHCKMESLSEENNGDNDLLSEVRGDDGSISKKDVTSRIQEIEKSITSPEIQILEEYLNGNSAKCCKLESQHKKLFDRARNKTGKVLQKLVKNLLKEQFQTTALPEDLLEEYNVLKKYLTFLEEETTLEKVLKDALESLDKSVMNQYSLLDMNHIKELLIEKKWSHDIFDKIDAIFSSLSHQLAYRTIELAERYEKTLPEIESKVDDYAFRVKEHLERMGF